MARDNHKVVMQAKRAGKSAASRKTQLINSLVQRGYLTDDVASTTTYVAMAKIGQLNKFFVGKTGDLRVGPTYKESWPADKAAKVLLKKEVTP